MGLEERQARPDRQDRRHKQARPQGQGHRRPATAPETPRAGPGILRRPASALYHRVTGIGRPTYELLGNVYRGHLLDVSLDPMGRVNLSFADSPGITRDDVVLPATVLARVERHAL